jgi:hypothetical protein
MESVVPTMGRPPRQRKPKTVRRAWTSDASVYRDVSWEASGSVLAASSSVATNRLAGGAKRTATKSHTPAQQQLQQQEHSRRPRPLSASYATSNRSAGLQKRQPLCRPASAGPGGRPRSAGPIRTAAPTVARPQSAGPLRTESAEEGAEDGDAATSSEFSGLGVSPTRTRDARARRPNSASASIRWLQPLDSSLSRARPASAAGRMQGSSRRAWNGYNIWCPRPDPVESDDGEEEAAIQAQLVSVARNEAAKAIQCAYRIHLARLTVAHRRQHVTEDRAATKLQARGRGWLARKHRKMEEYAALRIQAVWRGHAGRKKAAAAAEEAAAALAAIPYVPPPWGQKETEVLMMLCEREGLGSWTRKALQLGGRRTAEELNDRYFWVLRQRKHVQEEKEAEEEAVRQAEAAVIAEEKAERSRVRKERAAQAKRAAAAKRFSAGGPSNDRRAVWATGDSHNSAVAYKMSEDAKREAAEGAILEVLLRMLKGEKTLYGQKMGSAAEAFKLLDQDGSGQLDLQELTDGLKRLGLGLTEAQIARLALTLDEDNSGEISVDEFVEGLEKAVKARKARAEELRRKLGGGDDGGRVTEYPRPWTERPADLTPMQLLQRAAKKAALGRMIGAPGAGASNRDDTEKALKHCCLKGEADQKRLDAALAAIVTAEGQAEVEAEAAARTGGDEPKPRRYMLLLTADAKLKYRALYWLQHPDAAARKQGEDEVRGLRIAGSGPPRLRGDNVAMTLGYDAATKQFRPTLTEEQLGVLGPDYVVSLGTPAGMAAGAAAGLKPFDAVTLRVKKLDASSRLDNSREPSKDSTTLDNSTQLGSSSFGAASMSTSAGGATALGFGRRPLPSASVIYTGGQVGYSRSSDRVAERVDTTMSVLRALHNAKQAEAAARRRGSEPKVSMAATDAYDASTKTVSPLRGYL